MEVTLSDSDVLIDFLHNRGPGADAVRRLRRAGMLVTSTICRFEIYSGVRNDSERLTADQLFGSIRILTLSDEAALEAANINRALRASGNPLPLADLLIAGIAIAEKLPLLTRNLRHFSRITGLDVITP